MSSVRSYRSIPAAHSPETGEATAFEGRALYEQVAERVRHLILSHRLSSGSWIDEQALATEYGISRTPLREALKVLAAEGLVTMKMRRGAYVTETSTRDLSEVYHLLGLLEGDAASDVAVRATASELEELELLHLELETSVADRDLFFTANERFHMRLLVMAGNHWRHQLVLDLRKVMKLNRHHSLFKHGRIDASLKEHRQVMEALRGRDPEVARQLMHAHLKSGAKAALLDK